MQGGVPSVAFDKRLKFQVSYRNENHIVQEMNIFIMDILSQLLSERNYFNCYRWEDTFISNREKCFFQAFMIFSPVTSTIQISKIKFFCGENTDIVECMCSYVAQVIQRACKWPSLEADWEPNATMHGSYTSSSLPLSSENKSPC